MTSVDQAERLRHLARSATPSEHGLRSAESQLGANGVTANPGRNGTAQNSINGKNLPVALLQQEAKNTGHPKARTGATRRRIPFIAITSGKGGVGKSNIAVNLAIALSDSTAVHVKRRRITLIDADLGTANADVLCGINAPHTLAHLLQGRRRSLEEVAVDAPGGFRLVPGASGIRRVAEMSSAQRALLIREVSKLEQTNDLVLIDTGAGIGDAVTSMTGIADLVVVVLTPEPTSIADGYGLIKSIRRESHTTAVPHQRFAILVNMATSPHQARAVYDRVAAVSRRFLGLHLDFAGSIPQDSIIPRAVIKRTPFLLAHPHAPASRAIRQLAQSIAGFTLPAHDNIAGNGREVRASGYFSRLFHWIRPQN